MSRSDLNPLLISCIAAAFIKLSYPYPSYKDCSISACNNSTIRLPFQNNLTNLSSFCFSAAYVYCPDNQSTLFRPFDFSGSLWFRVVGGITQLSYTQRTIRIAPVGLFNCSALPEDINSTFTNFIYLADYDLAFSISSEYRIATILNCTKQTPYINNLQRIECLDCGRTNNSCFLLPPSLSMSQDESCSSYQIVVPADKNYNITAEKNLTDFLQKGFELQWKTPVFDFCQSCDSSGGSCFSAAERPYDRCTCPDGVHGYNCSDGILYTKKRKRTSKTIAMTCGIILGIATTVTVCIIVICGVSKRKRRKSLEEEEQEIRAYMDPLDSRPPSVDNFVQEGVPTRYSYAQLKRYTNNFANRLGKGGFGTVFKGRLPNGSLVAIKILDNAKHSRKQFMNEVATIGTIHHIHLVRLLGYCFQGSKRALVYDYMVNGSLEKYIHRDDQNALDWKQLYSIAMGTARGIAYLHDECRSRILHCDIKPHNILLDAHFSPKVADFGLAKLTDREESHISLTAARGTPGYVAPEMWSRNYGPVTDRSDVYSYGMLLMEMVGGRKNFDMQATRSSKFYYPEWAYKQVASGEFGRLREGNITDEEDENMAKKLSMLGLWCIQHNPSQRPPMSKVIQMLEGNIEITVPPLPFPVDTLIQTTGSTESSSSM